MFKFFRRTNNNEEKKVLSPFFAEKFLDRFENSLNISYRERNIKLKDNPIWQKIQAYDKIAREEVCLLALGRLIDKEDRKYNHEVIRRKLFKSEFNPRSPPNKESLIKLFRICTEVRYPYTCRLPANDILFCFQYYKENFGKDNHYMKARNALVKIYNESYGDANLKKIVLGLKKLDYDPNENRTYDRRDILGKHLDAQWATYDEEFQKIISHCWESGQKSKPTAKWLNTTKALIYKNKNKEQHIRGLSKLFELVLNAAKAEVKRLNQSSGAGHPDSGNDNYLSAANEIALSYLTWYAAILDEPVLNNYIGQLALSSYNKIKGVGCLSTKNGNACMYAFTLMSPKVGITQLLNIRNKTKNKSIKIIANNQMNRKAQELGISEEALLELSVPEFNLEGSLSKWEIGNYIGIIDIQDMKKPTTYWLNKETSKQQKSVPNEIKVNFKEELKNFQATIGEIKTAISVHAKRLENSYLDRIEWAIEDWKDKYLSHPFLSGYSPKLIWILDDKQTAIVKEGKLVTNNNSPLDLSQYQNVKLWHPIYSEIAEVTAWRNFILKEEIRQPFKQAYREIYVVTDAETQTNTYSNRFAAHILYQHQFSALAKTRDWAYRLQGTFDSHNTPSRLIPKFELRAEYWVEPVDNDMVQSGIYTYVTSDQVRIYSGREVMQMADVPKIVFSEIMRDVDLFVGVASIGNNPEWQDAGDRRTYWHKYSFGDLSETAKTRKAVLERIIPKLKIADRCELEDKFLTIKGNIRNYKIHLGSGNILMSPNDQYLCIVPNSRDANTKIFLPFDNDRTLSIILSKAFLLYNDDKIKDTSITRQIKL